MSAQVMSAQFNNSSTSRIISKKEVRKETPLILANKKMLSLTNFSTALKFNSINPMNSIVYSSGKDLLFDINFLTESDETLTLDGRHSTTNSKSEFNFSYQFEKEEFVNGEKVIGKYRFNLSIQAENLRSSKVNKHYEQEDLLQFVRRITNEIMEISMDNKKSLKGVIFSSEDLKELASSDQKSIGSLLQKLIYTLLMMEQLKNLHKKNENVEEVTLTPERKIYEVTEKENNQEATFNYSGSISRIEES